jgi:capsid portal protein
MKKDLKKLEKQYREYVNTFESKHYYFTKFGTKMTYKLGDWTKRYNPALYYSSFNEWLLKNHK